MMDNVDGYIFLEKPIDAGIELQAQIYWTEYYYQKEKHDV